MDGREDADEQIAADSHLGQLERDGTGVADSIRTALREGAAVSRVNNPRTKPSRQKRSFFVPPQEGLRLQKVSRDRTQRQNPGGSCTFLAARENGRSLQSVEGVGWARSGLAVARRAILWRRHGAGDGRSAADRRNCYACFEPSRLPCVPASLEQGLPRGPEAPAPAETCLGDPCAARARRSRP